MHEDVDPGDEAPAKIPDGASFAEDLSSDSTRPPAMTQVETATFQNDIWMGIVASLQDTGAVSVSAIADSVENIAKDREGTLKQSLENVSRTLREN